MPSEPDLTAIAAALRQVGRSLGALADALTGAAGEPTQDERYRAAILEWGDRALTGPECIALLRRHGFAPQAVGGWVKGGWMETGADGLRRMTARSRELVSGT
ncbi:hypothetical protein ACQEVB_00055 [Pseudonocardia sp. CA-107938]|uniref:hypothetical protein n=1 Tax=Pseudonocardia sp. CA-107938 TaxID=3240021 RepID=UPI003D918F84